METIIVALISSATTLAICLINNAFQMKKLKDETKKISAEQTEALKLGVQALLRDRLLWEYDKWQERGYCPYDKKQNIVNMHNQYEKLGENGVMNQAHETFMKLPLEQPTTN